MSKRNLLEISNVGSAGMILLDSQVASSVGSIDFTRDIDSKHTEYVVKAYSVVPATDGSNLVMRVSTDGGSTFVTGATSYSYAVGGLAEDSGTLISRISAGDKQIDLGVRGVGSTAGEGANFDVSIYDPSNAAIQTIIKSDASIILPAPLIGVSWGAGRYEATTAVNALSLFFATGDIASGEFRLFAVRDF